MEVMLFPKVATSNLLHPWKLLLFTLPLFCRVALVSPEHPLKASLPKSVTLLPTSRLVKPMLPLNADAQIYPVLFTVAVKEPEILAKADCSISPTVLMVTFCIPEHPKKAYSPTFPSKTSCTSLMHVLS